MPSLYSNHVRPVEGDGEVEQRANERATQSPAGAVAEKQADPCLAPGLLDAEVRARPGAQHTAQVHRAPGADAGHQCEGSRNSAMRRHARTRIWALVAQQRIVRPEPPHLVSQLGWGRKA